MISLDELLNRKPSRWGNITIKEFERDIAILREACRMYESAVREDDETKTRYSNDIERLLQALYEIDTRIRSTSEPVPYIIETLKKTLPEYDFEYDGESRTLDDWLR